MSTLKVDNLLNSAGNESPISVPGAAKAWVDFAGSGTVTIRDAFNVTSITDHNPGDYSINFTNNFASTGYACVGTVFHEQLSTNDMRVMTGQTKSVSSVRVNTMYANGSGGYDAPGLNVAVFGD